MTSLQAMTETWFSALLFSITGVVFVQANDCVVGVIGEHVVLPCFYHGVKNLTSLHISSEWRRGTEIMHSAVWIKGQMDTQNLSHGVRTSVSSLAPNTGDFSMELHDLAISDTNSYSFYLKLHGEKNNSLVCTVCLTIGGHFSHPNLIRENGVDGDKSRFFCNSKGGFPAPSVYWLVNQTQRPPETSVTTSVTTLPQSELYNITSVLSISISADTAVSCIIKNSLLDENITATNFVQINTAVGRRTEHIWPLTITLCVITSLLVAISLGFQWKWDRARKRNQNKEDLSSEGTDMIEFDVEQLTSLSETVV